MYRIDFIYKSPFNLADNIKVSAAFLAASRMIDIFDEVYQQIKNGSLRFSSVFPRGFLPKPRLPLSPELSGFLKKWKKIEFIPIEFLEYFNKNKNEFIKSVIEYYEKNNEILAKNNLIFRNNMRGEKTKLFYYDIKYFKYYNYSEASIYFDGDPDLVIRIFKLLGKLGISSRRNIGLGKIKYETISDPYEVKGELGNLLLSKTRLSQCDGYYGIDEINLISRYDRKLIKFYVFLEGSIFDETKPEGGIIERDNYIASLYPLFY